MLQDGFSPEIATLSDDGSWSIVQSAYAPETNLKHETIFTLANGYMGTRGSFEEGTLMSHPGNFIAGVFDRSEAQTQEIVNTPDWLGLRIYINAEPLRLDGVEIRDFVRILNMRKGLLLRKMICQDDQGRQTRIEGYRFLSRHNLHRAGIRWYITPLNYRAVISVESISDGTVTNWTDDPWRRVKHLTLVENARLAGEGCYLETETRQTRLGLGLGTALRINGPDGGNLVRYRKFAAYGEQAAEYCEYLAEANVTAAVTKYAVTYTSRDLAGQSLKTAVGEELTRFLTDGLDSELARHIQAYKELWRVADIRIEGDEEAQLALRFNIFHLMSSANEHDPRVSIAAKALHGEGYWGHVFWDAETYMLPFFVHTNPRAARSLLLYRYHTLDGARANAAGNGYRGAQYPWESTDTGREDTIKWWHVPDGDPIRVTSGDYEHHITADVALAVFTYYRATGDLDFMLRYGLEILLETARFWVSRCEYNHLGDRYEIKEVIGPDEFHEPVDDNYYTNYLARWNIQKALALLTELWREHASCIEGILSWICLPADELARFAEVAGKIHLPADKESQVLEQFAGYFQKEDHPITEFDGNGMPVWPPGMNQHRANSTQLIKQADVIMLLHLMADCFDEETKRACFAYYEKRTMHKSSLSPSIYAIVGLGVGEHAKAYSYFMKTALTDLRDNQGNAAEGLHAASTGGTWQVAVCGFGGMHVDSEGVLCFTPWLPETWRRMSFRVYWRGNLLEIDLRRDEIKAALVEGDADSLEIKLGTELVCVRKAADGTKGALR